ncbi:MAG: hypothetical protein LQ343_002085 [Gyalolechia ehrenbergii]|nr:MAG: hypothetical protein LQ343_002085 [Gyalolechia ehrenbergii]
MHLEPWQSWAIVGLGAAGAYIYYSQTGYKRRSKGHAPFVPNLAKRPTSPRRGSSVDAGSGSSGARRKSQPKKSDNPVEANATEALSTSVPQSGNGRLKKRKGGKKESGQLAQSSAVDIAESQATGTNNQKDEVDNREFAKQMSGLKTGSSFANIEGSRKQTKKASKQAKLPLNSFDALSPDTSGTSISKDLSNASSTTGADADDDLSPATSPPLGATPTATSGGVEDMLEPPTKGPSVFRLTGVEEPKRQAKPQKAAEELETKKQRQNRKKNEEKKLAREEAERERRVLLEKQRRTAREAEGRPARNGVASAPATNAWGNSQPGRTASQQEPLAAPNGALLDTFEDHRANAANGHSNKSQGVSAAGMQAWQNEVPSEEEQMRILSEMEGSGGWNTVAKGGKSKKKPAASTNENERKMSTATASVTGTGDHSTSTSDDAIPQLTPSQSQTEDEALQKSKIKKEDIDPKVWNRSNIHLHPDYDPSYPYALTGHPEDSDWAVV